MVPPHPDSGSSGWPPTTMTFSLPGSAVEPSPSGRAARGSPNSDAPAAPTDLASMLRREMLLMRRIRPPAFLFDVAFNRVDDRLQRLNSGPPLPIAFDDRPRRVV